MIKASKFAIAIAAVASLAIATMKVIVSCAGYGRRKYRDPAATSEVVYRGYFGDDYGPYAYRPAYTYRGYTYWYPNSTVNPGDYLGDYYNWW